MKLTALEIKQQEFDKSLRGYDTAEVHAFLNLVASEWEHLVSRQREMENEMEQMRDKLKHYQRVEEALHETLQTAKESAEQKMSGARREAQSKIEKAEMEAESILREARQQRQQIRQSILRLLDRREEIIGGIRSYLELAQESLSQFTRDEAAMFSLPKEDETEGMSTFERRLRAKHQTSDGEAPQAAEASQSEETSSNGNISIDQPSSSQASPVPPGAEDVDDLLDDID
ncbi:MAG: DivIVA domain-containing protein [Bacteroidota bacterium]